MRKGVLTSLIQHIVRIGDGQRTDVGGYVRDGNVIEDTVVAVGARYLPSGAVPAEVVVGPVPKITSSMIDRSIVSGTKPIKTISVERHRSILEVVIICGCDGCTTAICCPDIVILCKDPQTRGRVEGRGGRSVDSGTGFVVRQIVVAIHDDALRLRPTRSEHHHREQCMTETGDEAVSPTSIFVLQNTFCCHIVLYHIAK